MSAAAPSPALWTRSHRVRASELDARGRLSELALCHLMQDAASEHAHTLGISGRLLRPRHLTWVLARLLVEMGPLPGWQAEVAVATWPSENQRLMAFRHFELQDGEGRRLARGASAWVLMDTRSGRPQRLELLGADLPRVLQRPEALRNPRKLDPPDRVDQQREFRVRYRDLDENGHVNNVSHLEWALESLPPALHHNGRLVTLEANFLGEAFGGDTVRAAVAAPAGRAAGLYHHCVRLTPEGPEILRAVSQWELDP